MLEVDLPWRDRRHVPPLVQLPEHHSCCSLWRVQERKIELWAISLFEPLPVLTVPLRQGLDMIYQCGLYSLSIDYSQVPLPLSFFFGRRAGMDVTAAGQ